MRVVHLFVPGLIGGSVRGSLSMVVAQANAVMSSWSRGAMSSGPQPVAPRALVIEDAADVRDLWAHELERVGFNVFRAEDGETGMREVQRVDPILIVLDLMLPGVNGFSVARWVRELDRGRDVAILAVSALTHQTLRREAFDAGCDAFLAKPTTGEALILEAARLLGGRVSLKRRWS